MTAVFMSFSAVHSYKKRRKSSPKLQEERDKNTLHFAVKKQHTDSKQH